MRNEYIPKVLKEYRKKNKYTVNDVSIMLHERSLDVAPKTIYGWESGQANPSADMLLTLCEMYNITDILAAFGFSDNGDFHVTNHEQALIESYRHNIVFTHCNAQKKNCNCQMTICCQSVITILA